MNWVELSREESSKLFDQFCESGEFSSKEEYQSLREDMCLLFENALKEIGITEDQIQQKNYSYQLDLRFGIKLYTTLNQKYGMNVRFAATEGIWRYLSICVVPDLIEKRYGKDHPDRFWKKPKRLWLRVLWWYIYLSWQGTEEATVDVLKDNSTDEILQLVDRCGRGGYRVELYREMMWKNSQLDPSERRKNQLFRKMMVLNTARVQVMEPELALGGNKGYVESLCDYFMN